MFFPPNVIKASCASPLSACPCTFMSVFFCFVLTLAAYCVVSASPSFFLPVSLHFAVLSPYLVDLFTQFLKQFVYHSPGNLFFPLKYAPTMGTRTNVRFGTILWLIKGPIFYPFSDFSFCHIPVKQTHIISYSNNCTDLHRMAYLALRLQPPVKMLFLLPAKTS